MESRWDAIVVSQHTKGQLKEQRVSRILFFRELYDTKNRDRMNMGLYASLI